MDCLHEEQIFYSKFLDRQARANIIDPDQTSQKATSQLDLHCLHKVHDFYSKYVDRQAYANSKDPDHTSTECDISCKEWQLRAISVDPDKTPTVYPICSK